MIGLLVAVGALVLVQRGRVRCDRSIEYLHEINAMHTQLDEDFLEKVKDVYYKTKQAAEAQENYPLLAIATAMAEYEAAWYAAQKRGLVCSEVLLIRYFIAQSRPLDRILVRGDNLIDMMIKRTMERAIKEPKVLAELDKHRKKVYLYLKRYTGEVDGVDELAHKYARHIVHMKAVTMLARRDFDLAAYKYRRETPLMDFDGFALTAMASLEVAIDGAWADKEVAEMDMIDQYKDLVMSVVAAKLIAHDFVYTYEDEHLRPVDMNDVAAYEESVLRGRIGLASFSMDLSEEVESMERKFADNMREMFYEQQELGARLNSYPLMAVSCQMAEIQSLLMVDLRRMRLQIRSLLTRQEQKLGWIFEVNPYAVEFMVQHLIGYSIEHALIRVLSRRKKLYLSLMRYEVDEHVRDLARTYYKHMYVLNYQLRETKGLSEMYKDLVMTKTPPEHLPTIVDDVNELIQRGVHAWTLRLKDMRLLSMSLDKTMYKDIKASYKRSFNKIYRASAITIDSVTEEDINRHERELLGYQMRTL